MTDDDGPGGAGTDADSGSGTTDGDGESTANWPVSLTGVTETVAATLGPNGLWNLAALGLFAPERADEPVTARTWGRTRTRGNFHRRGEGYVLFVDDPVLFADAALSIVEREAPVPEAANAWARVAADPINSGTDRGTDWEEWALRPLESGIERETVPTIDRGFGAVVEATVAASRLGVAGYDEGELRDRLAYCASVVDRAGGPREREALERVREESDW